MMKSNLSKTPVCSFEASNFVKAITVASRFGWALKIAFAFASDFSIVRGRIAILAVLT